MEVMLIVAYSTCWLSPCTLTVTVHSDVKEAVSAVSLYGTVHACTALSVKHLLLREVDLLLREVEK